MVKQLFFWVAIIACSATFFSSCYHLPALPINALPKDSIVCFQNDVLPVLQSYCGKSGCHNGDGRGIDFTTYEGVLREVDVANPINSRLITAIYRRGNGKMPPSPNPPLTQQQIDLIYTWIQQGAHNTSCNEVCDTTSAITYSGNVQPILNTYCIGCHNGVSSGTTINLTNYNGTYQTVVSNRLLGAIEQLPGYYAMPQGSKLSDCKIAIIQKWINAGALNN